MIERYRRQVVLGAVLAGLAALTALPALASRALVPMALRRSRPDLPMPTRIPPDASWSEVLLGVPLPRGADLVFFEMRPTAEPPSAVAEYLVAGMDASALGLWYRDRLADLGWRPQSVLAGGQSWVRQDAWLRVELPSGGGSRWLRLTRDVEGVSPGDGRSLVADLPLPPGAVRWRYDRSDVLAEELRLSSPAAQAAHELDAALAAEGWLRQDETALTGARLWRYDLDDRVPILVTVRPLAEGGTEVGLGTTDCVSRSSAGSHAESVYLEGVPAPAGSTLTAFDREPDGGGVERWLSPCQDLDLLIASAVSSWSTRGWSAVASGSRRGAGSAYLFGTSAPSTGVGLEARALPAGAVDVRLMRPADGCRPTSGVSLLDSDLPVPTGAESEQLRIEAADAWPQRETYGVPDGVSRTAAWVGPAMVALGWLPEREDAATSAAQVFHRGGEEVLASITADEGVRLTWSRRRVCPSDQIGSVSSDGGRARYLAEMPVFPGATYDWYLDGVEEYVARCTSLDQLEDWYRRALERGDWSLATVVGSGDRFTRTLVFVRPAERSLPPALRSAWAEVKLERTWPYSYRLRHTRDSTGVLPRDAR